MSTPCVIIMSILGKSQLITEVIWNHIVYCPVSQDCSIVTKSIFKRLSVIRT